MFEHNGVVICSVICNFTIYVFMIVQDYSVRSLVMWLEYFSMLNKFLMFVCLKFCFQEYGLLKFCMIHISELGSRQQLTCSFCFGWYLCHNWQEVAGKDSLTVLSQLFVPCTANGSGYVLLPLPQIPTYKFSTATLKNNCCHQTKCIFCETHTHLNAYNTYCTIPHCTCSQHMARTNCVRHTCLGPGWGGKACLEDNSGKKPLALSREQFLRIGFNFSLRVQGRMPTCFWYYMQQKDKS